MQTNIGDDDKAIVDCTEAIRVDPKDAEAYFSRGEAYGRNQDFDKAIADYSKAIRLDPRFAEAHYVRGRAYLRKGVYNKAKVDFAEAKRLDLSGRGNVTGTTPGN